MKTTTFLTFVGDQCGKVKEAMDFYISLFPNSEIREIIYYKDGEMGGSPNLIKHATFILNGHEVMASENNYKHAWTFSPGVSFFIECSTSEEIDQLFQKLSSDGGQVMVPLDNYAGQGDYGFGQKFGWCEDKYGISWQLNLSA